MAIFTGNSSHYNNTCSSRVLQFLRHALFLSNLVLFLLGLFGIAQGIYIYTRMRNYIDIFGNAGFINSATVLIIVSGIVTLISFLGCCGAIEKNACMLYTFGAFMAMIILAEIVLITIVFTLVGSDTVKETISTAMKNGLQNYHPGNVSYAGVTNIWDILQQSYACCGVGGAADWGETSQVPDSCCKVYPKGCSKDGEDIHREGCFTKLTNIIEGNLLWCGGIGAVLGVIQIVAFTGVLTLARKRSKFISISSNY